MKKYYILFLNEGFNFRTFPDPVILTSACSHQDAIARATEYLSIKGELTPEKFHEAGGREIRCCMEEVVFPK